MHQTANYEASLYHQKHVINVALVPHVVRLDFILKHIKLMKQSAQLGEPQNSKHDQVRTPEQCAKQRRRKSNEVQYEKPSQVIQSYVL